MIQAANSPYNSTAQDKVVYLQTDHLGTPRAATDAAKRVVWRWEMQSDAFGADGAQQDPDGDGVATIIYLRFPGQYYDAESGLHYNWNRYYDPSLGRYISSDPIGLAGGLNTFGYVGQSPLNQTDMNGLCPFCVAVVPFLGGTATASSTGLGFWATGAVVGGGLVVATLPGDTSSQGADSSSTDEGESCSPTEHAKDRAEQAKTDEHRQVGDPNKVLEKGRKFLDTDTGNIVHVDGDRVVITDSNRRRITQFKNTKKNTQDRVRSGRWIPM